MLDILDILDILEAAGLHTNYEYIPWPILVFSSCSRREPGSERAREHESTLHDYSQTSTRLDYEYEEITRETRDARRGGALTRVHSML